MRQPAVRQPLECCQVAAAGAILNERVEYRASFHKCRYSMTLMGAGRYTSTMNLPALLPEPSRLISEAPSSPGVYIIYGEPTGLPLYIGKSINIRSRLQSHSRSPKSRRFLDRAQRIEYRLTAGE